MDKLLTSLVDFIQATDFETLTPGAVRAVVRHTTDTVGCGAGGFASQPAGIAREVTRGIGGPLVASMYGEPEKYLVDQVAFTNATADRYLDFNDFGVSGHPSDMIPALLAMTEAMGGTGADAVTAIYLAYEIATRLAEAVPPDGGWDQGVYCSLGIAAGQAKILRLPREKIAHALSLAVVPGIPLRVTRFGELSEWKAAATGHAAMTATFAVRLAAAGMSGPSEPFEGKDGLLERVWPTFDLTLTRADPSAIERASLKRHPACYWGQVPVDLVTELRDRAALSEIVAIDVATCANAWRSIGGGRGDAAEKWRPPTRETADHSMPYLMAAAFVDGELSDAAFTSERLTDPELFSIIDRISVVERFDLTNRATRDSCPTELTLTMVDGSTLSAAADVPRGHPANPMSDAEVREKFESLALRALAPDQAGALGALLARLPELESLDAVTTLFRAFERR
ncbi:MmgE/PrpD family protein [Rhodococcus pseudokoreensis]|uniref:MmgE/PrpD family protein n=1 Tax=Rhodococcus pseudokoreensis TaxID=2811421 RepID=A0A974ZWK3_9NOCA|nr:MmgE/PrpD family protein [Rhodococcus pseudokoreensis]QSE92995.1 MmgE/PrpD family protein [Rhodococcus pseudokoreensis]